MKFGDGKIKDILILLAIGTFSMIIIKILNIKYCDDGLKKCFDEVSNKIYSIATNTKDKDSFKNDIKNEFSNTASHVLDDKLGDEKIYTAANFLWGNYIRNTITRPQYCSNIGVAIFEFSVEFRENNKEAYKDITSIRMHQKRAYGYFIKEEEIYSSTQVKNLNDIKIDMIEIARLNFNNDVKLTCESFSRNAKDFAISLSLDKTMPEFSKIVKEGVSQLK